MMRGIVIPKQCAGKIQLTCGRCGKTRTVAREPYDPANAVLCITNECDRCHAASGGFGEAWYFDAKGSPA